MANGIRLKGDVKQFTEFLNPSTFTPDLYTAIRKATLKSSLYMVKAVRDAIRNREYGENAPLTLALKKGNMPLLEDMNLFNAISHKLTSSLSAEIGIIENRESTGSMAGRNKRTIKMQKLTELLHSGYTITVTPKMRKAIAMALSQKYGKDQNAENLNSLKSKLGNTTYYVRPYPFLSNVFSKPEIDTMVQKNWREALEEFFKDRGAK